MFKTSSRPLSRTVAKVGWLGHFQEPENLRVSVAQIKQRRGRWNITATTIAFLWLGVAIPSAALAFSTSDLTGTWHIFTFSDLPLRNDPRWTTGTMSINSVGIVTGGSFVNANSL